MNWWRSLRVRLLASYVAVAMTGAVVLLATIRLLVPPLFDRRMGAGMGMGRGATAGTVARDSLMDALIEALDRALFIAVGASLVAAAVIAVVVARRILRPVDDIRDATRRLADGHYDERVEPPRERELAALAEDVNALAGSLAETERRRAELVSDLAHELRTPLTTIRGYTEGISDGIIAPDPNVLGAMRTEVDRLETLAGDLSTLSRMDEGAFALDPGPVDLTELSGTVAGRFARPAGDKDVHVSVAAPGPVVVGADRDRIEQVLTNLVANAVAYTPAGGKVTVTTSADPAGGARITVTDTGVGLAAHDAERVFDRFYRVDGVPRAPGGSGIGLAIARGIARAHGGDLTAASAGPGRGSTFTLTLPPSRPPSPR